MDAYLIQTKIDNLAYGIYTDVISYEELINLNQEKAFWISQVALAQCYKYDFNFKLAQKAKLLGNAKFFKLRAQLEQNLKTFIKDHFSLSIEPWDMTKSADEYIDYAVQIIRHHSSFHHRFFTKFLSQRATLEDFRFYLAQESAPRFDDLLALLQIGMPVQMKMELAKNYWDEMGNGHFNNVHAMMFANVLRFFNVTNEYSLENTLLFSYVADNLSAMLALYRENYAHAIGFLAATEYCVPQRFKFFIEGCRRLGITNDILSYHILHTDIDGHHAEGWFREVVKPLIEHDPIVADKITAGIFLKLNSSQFVFDSLLEKLTLNSSII